MRFIKTIISSLCIVVLSACSTAQVPLSNIPSSYIYKAPHTFEYNNRSLWEQLEYKLANDPHSTITIDMDGMGGKIDMLGDFANVIRKLEKEGHNVIMEVKNEATSAHAMAAMLGDEIWLSEKAVLYFHAGFILDNNNKRDYSVMDNRADQAVMNASFDAAKQKGMLSDTDINNILQRHLAVINEKINGRIVRKTVKEIPPTGYPYTQRIE